MKHNAKKLNDIIQQRKTCDDKREYVLRGVFELDLLVLPTNIFLLVGHQDQIYNNLFVFRSTK